MTFTEANTVRDFISVTATEVEIHRSPSRKDPRAHTGIETPAARDTRPELALVEKTPEPTRALKHVDCLSCWRMMGQAIGH